MLEGRAIPEEILAKAPESPWSFPTDSMRRRAEWVIEQDPTPSTHVALEALPENGTVLDVGVGSGAASLPLHSRASLIVGVDTSEELLAVFQELAAKLGVKTEIVAGRWPDVEKQAGQADVVVCHHVLYNVAEIAPFVRALAEHARRRVVLEITKEHPVAWMNDLWIRFHGVEFPPGPTSNDALEAMADMGLEAESREWTRNPTAGFSQREEAIAFIRRRLCLPAERDAEIESALGDRLIGAEGGWRTGVQRQHLVTIWWDTHRDRSNPSASTEGVTDII